MDCSKGLIKFENFVKLQKLTLIVIQIDIEFKNLMPMFKFFVSRLHSANVAEEEPIEDISTPKFQGEASPTVFM